MVWLGQAFLDSGKRFFKICCIACFGLNRLMCRCTRALPDPPFVGVHPLALARADCKFIRFFWVIFWVWRGRMHDRSHRIEAWPTEWHWWLVWLTPSPTLALHHAYPGPKSMRLKLTILESVVCGVGPGPIPTRIPFFFYIYKWLLRVVAFVLGLCLFFFFLDFGRIFEILARENKRFKLMEKLLLI